MQMRKLAPDGLMWGAGMQSDHAFLQFQAIQVVNVVVGAVSLLAVLVQLAFVGRRLYQVRGRHW